MTVLGVTGTHRQHAGLQLVHLALDDALLVVGHREEPREELPVLVVLVVLSWGGRLRTYLCFMVDNECARNCAQHKPYCFGSLSFK